MKLLAFGPKGVFISWRNIADILISLLGLCYIIWATVVLASGSSGVSHLLPLDLCAVKNCLLIYTCSSTASCSHYIMYMKIGYYYSSVSHRGREVRKYKHVGV